MVVLFVVVSFIVVLLVVVLFVVGLMVVLFIVVLFIVVFFIVGLFVVGLIVVGLMVVLFIVVLFVVVLFIVVLFIVVLFNVHCCFVHCCFVHCCVECCSCVKRVKTNGNISFLHLLLVSTEPKVYVNRRVLRGHDVSAFGHHHPGFHHRHQVREIFLIHVGGTRCVTSSTDNIMKIHARITLTVEFIRGCIFICLFDV